MKSVLPWGLRNNIRSCYTVMAYIVMAFLVMACIVMAYIVMAYIVMALSTYGPIQAWPIQLWPYAVMALYSYGLQVVVELAACLNIVNDLRQ